jgi:hypothetical protein
MWLTVPVLHKGKFGQEIREVEIDNNQNWQKKHIAALQQNYSKARYFSNIFPTLAEIIAAKWERLLDLNMALINSIAEFMSLESHVVLSSDLNVEGDKNTRLIDICRYFKAKRYLSGNAAQDYLDVKGFAEEGIEVEWQNYKHPIYEQINGEFISYLSIVDLLFNEGENSSSILTRVI